MTIKGTVLLGDFKDLEFDGFDFKAKEPKMKSEFKVKVIELKPRKAKNDITQLF